MWETIAKLLIQLKKLLEADTGHLRFCLIGAVSERFSQTFPPN